MTSMRSSFEAVLQSMTDDQYRTSSAIAQSDLKLIKTKSLHHYKNQIRTESTPAQILGSAIHAAVFEPALFRREFIGFAGDRRSKKARKEWEVLSLDHTVLSQKDFELCEEIARAIRKDKIAGPLIEDCVFEQCAFSPCELTGLMKKAKLDGYKDGLILDLKTTVNAEPDAFTRDIFKYGYHFQAAYYTDIMKELTGKDHKFIIIAVEKTAPFAVSTFEMSTKTMAIGRTDYRHQLGRLRRAMDTEQWPGYEQMNIVTPPKWLEADWFKES